MSRSALAASVRSLRARLAAQHDPQTSDEELLHAFAANSAESAFAALTRRHGPMVLHVCRRVLGHQQDAEDCFQATFLVLARNAAALRNKTALASWLHGIAYRTAMKAKRSAARRRKHEGSLGALTQPRSPIDPADELSWREVRTLLDEEIAQLTEIYRSAFILCCLENASHAEAGRRLGVKEKTVSSRLTEARRRLQRRLARRGLELSALLAAAALTAETSAALPRVLFPMTGSAPSPAVAALADGGASILSFGKAKLTAALVLIMSALSGAHWWLSAKPQAAVAPPAEARAAKADDTPRTVPPKPEAAQTVEVQGRVFGPDGKPKAGAKLLWLPENKKTILLGTSAADGRFTVAVPKKKSKHDWIDYLIAQSDGNGIDFLNSRRMEPGKPVELRLVKDHAIRGRIVNTEGKPIHGVRMAAKHVAVYANNSLDSFLIAWMKRDHNSIPDGVKEFWDEGAVLLATTTDADGRFVVHGVGGERLVKLYLRGAGIAATELWVVNRDSFDPKPYNRATLDLPNVGSFPLRTMLSKPDVSVVVEAEKIIRGVVTADDSGKGLAGLAVHLTLSGDRLLPIDLQAKTNAEGRYEIRGIRKAKSYVLQILKDPARGYLGNQIRVEDTAGYAPLTANIALKKGVIVTGKVIDRASGKSLPGDVEMRVLNDNPYAKDYPKYDYPWLVFHAETGEDGTFREVTMPGPVLLMGTADLNQLPGGEAEWRGYKKPIPDPKYPQYFRVDARGITRYLGLNGIPGAVQGSACKVLDIKPGAAVVHQDLVLERDSVRFVKIQDAEGRSISRVWATGLRPRKESSPVRLKGDSCPAYAVEAGKPRLMIFYERGRKLAGSLRLTADAKEPIAVKLGPAGAIRGRLLDADGKPLAGVVVDVRYRDREAQDIHAIVHEAKQAVTDAAGAFALDELIPQLKFELSFRRGKPRFERTAKPAETTIEVKPGANRDLGAIKLKPTAEKAGG